MQIQIFRSLTMRLSAPRRGYERGTSDMHPTRSFVSEIFSDHLVFLALQSFRFLAALNAPRLPPSREKTRRRGCVRYSLHIERCSVILQTARRVWYSAHSAVP